MSASHSQRKKCSLLGDLILTVIFNLPSKTENYSYRYNLIPLLPLTSHQKKKKNTKSRRFFLLFINNYTYYKPLSCFIKQLSTHLKHYTRERREPQFTKNGYMSIDIKSKRRKNKPFNYNFTSMSF